MNDWLLMCYRRGNPFTLDLINQFYLANKRLPESADELKQWVIDNDLIKMVEVAIKERGL